MWTIHGGPTSSAADPTRRSFLRAGVLGLGGAGLGGLDLGGLGRLRAAGQASGQSPGYPGGRQDTSVILFWLSGGPGHMETWDPKPGALAEYRGPFGATRTSVPGVQFGELLPAQARRMHRVSVVRTVNHGSGDHTKANHWMLTGFEGPSFNAPDFMVQRRPSIGAAVSRLRGAATPGMPPYAAVPHLRGGTDNFFHYAAYLGAGANPFIAESDPNLAGFRVKNLSLARDLTLDRLRDRRTVRRHLDGLRREGELPVAQLDEHYQRAFDLLTSRQVAAAFDVEAEPDRLRETYGRHTFGQSALVARRLVEAGVTFVTVNCVPWDHHGTGTQLTTVAGAKLLIPPLDRAVAGLIDDLGERGLTGRVLVVVMGEFGRTPRMNKDAGRDHWGHAFSVLFSGGRLKMGQVVGKTTPRGEYVTDRPVSPQDVASTVYHHLGIDAGKVLFPDAQRRPVALIESGQPIRELVG